MLCFRFATIPPKSLRQISWFVEAYDFTVQDGVLNGQFAERFLQRMERLEVVAVAADEFAFSVFDVSQRSEAVMFQLEDVVGVVEWLRNAS
jgi:hypothetical protein